MAYFYSRRRGRAKRWLYHISVLSIFALVVVFIYGRNPFGQGKAVAPKDAFSSLDNETILNVVEPVTETQEELNLLQIPQPTKEDNKWAAELISEAVSYIEARPAKIIEARDKLNEALQLPMSEQQRKFVKKQLAVLAQKWLFSRTVFPGDQLCGSYNVQPGDLLSTIGKRYKVPYQIIMEINNISRPEALRAGEYIKVINGPFHARVYRSTFTMDLFLQDTYILSFPVGLGKPGMETPTGLWAVKSGGKLIAPTWVDPVSGKTYEPEDPDYPLGSRWIGLEGLKGDAVGRSGFAIHGTKDPDQIGTAGSRGCIRMRNQDVELLYNLQVPLYSRVEVVE